MKKFLSLAIVGALMLPVVAQAETLRDMIEKTAQQVDLNFKDVSTGHPNFNAIAYLFEREVVTGYDDKTFRPNDEVNRAELTKMVVGMLEGEPNAIANRECFRDVAREWFAPYVCFAKTSGWVDGYKDKGFHPGDPVNRAEAMKIIVNTMMKEEYWPTPTDAEKALQMPSDADMSGWYGSYLRFAIAKELLDGQHVVEGDNGTYTYGVGGNMTRKEVAEMIYRTYVYMVERLEVAEIISDTSCFQLSHSSMTETEAHDLWVTSYLGENGYTEAEVDELQSKYADDDVVDAMVLDFVKYKCGGGSEADIEKWTAFKRFGN